MRGMDQRGVAVAATAAGIALLAAGCGSGESADGTTTISFLVTSDEPAYSSAVAMAKAFEDENPDIKVDVESRPGGTEGDNLLKTKLSTGEMNDVFYYNAGSLLLALNPDQNLVDLSDQPWVEALTDTMKSVVSTENGLYGSPYESSQAGAVVYNKKIYADLGLEAPTSWEQFAANNDAITQAGKAAVIQTYGDTWTSQLFVLGDFGNVLAQEPDWATDYTANKAHYGDQPAEQAFLNLQTAGESGWFNEDFASATLDDGIRMVATGEGAHYPIVTGTLATLQQNYPDEYENVGVFPLPAQDPADTRLTVWLPNSVYIPKTTEGAELDAAKKFVQFINSDTGCGVINDTMPPTGPYGTNTCALPDDVPPLLTDMQQWFDEGKTEPALEFLSAIKGPSLENITVEVGSGIRSGADGAALYDEDVKKQAQQLGLDGW